MFPLFTALLQRFTPRLDDIQQSHERFLSEAVDMHDLEVRMRRLDGGHSSIYRNGPHGIFMA
jgi:Protein of unknown function (DUF3563)